MKHRDGRKSSRLSEPKRGDVGRSETTVEVRCVDPVALGTAAVNRHSTRRSLLILGCLIVAASTLVPRPSYAQKASLARKTPVVLAVKKAQPSVVSISSEKKASSNSRWPFSAEESQHPRVNGMGTGVVIDSRGYILTNQHVVDKVQGIEVRLADGGAYPARVVQQDPAFDLAIIKIDAGRSLTPIVIGTSSDLMVGEQVITIGNAFGYENTVSVGIISYLGRNVTLSDDMVYRNLIQTDACINPGNSGGPLVNIDGELIGINVAVRAGAQGIGFALPIDDVKRVATDLLSTKRNSGMWHGIVVGETRDEDDRDRGVVVTDILPGSPAESAGLKTGDKILKIGDVGVANSLDIERGFLDSRPGKAAAVVVQREGHNQAVSLEVQPLPRSIPDAGDRVWRSLGIRVVPVNSEYVARVSSKLNGGLYIQAIAANSPASRGSLKKGDILVGMNVGERHWETIRADNVLYIVRQFESSGSDALHYYVVRQNAVREGSISLAEPRVSRAVTQ